MSTRISSIDVVEKWVISNTGSESHKGKALMVWHPRSKFKICIFSNLIITVLSIYPAENLRWAQSSVDQESPSSFACESSRAKAKPILAQVYNAAARKREGCPCVFPWKHISGKER